MFSGADAVSLCWHNDASETIGLYRGHWVNSPSPRIQHWQGSGPLDAFQGLLMRSKCLCSRGCDPNPTVAAITLPGSLASEQGNPFPSPTPDIRPWILALWVSRVPSRQILRYAAVRNHSISGVDLSQGFFSVQLCTDCAVVKKFVQL